MAGHAQQASSESEPQRLQQENTQQVPRPSANRLQNCQHVHPLFQMRMHRHGHANSAQHHRHQANQAQNRGRVIQSPAQRRIPFAIIHHLRIGQRRLQLRAHRRRGRICRKPARRI